LVFVPPAARAGSYRLSDLEPSSSPTQETPDRTSDREKGPSPESTTTFTISNGLRVDNFRYNIAGDITGHNPNILSELTWNELKTYQIKGELTKTVGHWLYLRGGADYGWILSGSMQDSDYLGDNRTDEFSRSVNDSNGSVVDSSLGAGYPFIYQVGDTEAMFAPMVGYAYNLQRFHITNLDQVIPNLGAFPGLDSSLRTQWYGPWMGADMSWKLNRHFKILSGIEYHWLDYRAVDNHNLRTDLQHPESVVFTATGTGINVNGGVEYSFKEWISLQMKLDYVQWKAGQGLDTTFFSDGTTGTTLLNEVRWSSWYYSLGLAFHI